ncbi:FCS-Like Zinc finger 5-like [Phoenix dactylifera]|uniref:FCS-Like Zinc finger 5-like n=1 Tax=Phoenix dactylifera TaxID=42345 RepID=A0A8B7CQ32_PHODC|nr:FCS-Like Zinc finger 5-like [Phoenix dactylifera]
MLMGKRPRSPMRRTTIAAVFSAADLEAASEASDEGGHQRLRRTAPMSAQRRSFSDFELAGTASFLSSCGLCKRHLGPGVDTYIYRGEIAFCSLQCRQHQINLDDQKEK